MSKKRDYQLKKWKCLVQECRESGMMVKDWCTANDIPKHQYYYWLAKIRSECYEEAVNQLQTVEPDSCAAVPAQVPDGAFVEISPGTVSGIPNSVRLSQPVAVVHKGSIRIEIMSNAPASFIMQLLEAVHYA